MAGRRHPCALPTIAERPGSRFQCPVCEAVWVYEPFKRAWRYAVSPGGMAFRWLITLLTFRSVDLIRVGWKRKRGLDLGIAGHWLLVALHSLAVGALVLW